MYKYIQLRYLQFIVNEKSLQFDTNNINHPVKIVTCKRN